MKIWRPCGHAYQKEIEDLTFIKKYVIILYIKIFTDPIGEQAIEALFDNY